MRTLRAIWTCWGVVAGVVAALLFESYVPPTAGSRAALWLMLSLVILIGLMLVLYERRNPQPTPADLQATLDELLYLVREQQSPQGPEPRKQMRPAWRQLLREGNVPRTSAEYQVLREELGPLYYGEGEYGGGTYGGTLVEDRP